jgi:hypothetical protein
MSEFYNVFKGDLTHITLKFSQKIEYERIPLNLFFEITVTLT